MTLKQKHKEQGAQAKATEEAVQEKNKMKGFFEKYVAQIMPLHMSLS